jgi:hypothetical protein
VAHQFARGSALSRAGGLARGQPESFSGGDVTNPILNREMLAGMIKKT